MADDFAKIVVPDPATVEEMATRIEALFPIVEEGPPEPDGVVTYVTYAYGRDASNPSPEKADRFLCRIIFHGLVIAALKSDRKRLVWRERPAYSTKDGIVRLQSRALME